METCTEQGKGWSIAEMRSAEDKAGMLKALEHSQIFFGNDRLQPFIGGSDEGHEGTWKWAKNSTIFYQDGKPVNGMYQNWFNQYDQVNVGPGGINGNCLQMLDSGKWLAARCLCHKESFVLCELPTVKGKLIWL